MQKLLVESIVLVSVVVALRAWAGFEEGVTAYHRGDYATAFREFLPLAQQGVARAQFNLGVMYGLGKGVPQDYSQAVAWYRKAAEQGDAGAQFNLGVMYELGMGVPQDYPQAMYWYRQGAEQGDADAQKGLGWMYVQGHGVPQDYSQAVAWYRKAATQGHAIAQGDLCVMYDLGMGVPQDFMQAYLWCNLASANLSGPVREQAVRNRDKVAAQLSPAQLAQAQALAREWRPKLETPGSAAPAPSQVLPSMPVSSSPRRDLVRQVQERLQAQGFTPGAIDGSMGPQTQQALRWFQNTKGLLPTGELDEKTLDALGLR